MKPQSDPCTESNVTTVCYQRQQNAAVSATTCHKLLPRPSCSRIQLAACGTRTNSSHALCPLTSSVQEVCVLVLYRASRLYFWFVLRRSRIRILPGLYPGLVFSRSAPELSSGTYFFLKSHGYTYPDVVFLRPSIWMPELYDEIG
jgi:hypothetical protein